MAGRCRLVAGSLLLALALVAQPAPRPLDRTATGPPTAEPFIIPPPPIIHLWIGDIPLSEIEPHPAAPSGGAWDDAARGRDKRPPAAEEAPGNAARAKDAETSTRAKHTVAPGESLWAISRVAGMRVLQLAAMNRLSPRMVLRPGQTIVVTAPNSGVAAARPKSAVARVIAFASAAPPSTEAFQSSAAPMISPSYGTVTSRFGWRIHPIFGTPEFHTGLDIANRYGTPVRAALGGIVRFAGWMAGYGRLIVIDHGGGMQTSYSHLSAMLVSLGERVFKGQILGQIGSTGWSTGPHLFFEVRRNGVPVDPIPLLRRSGALVAGRAH